MATKEPFLLGNQEPEEEEEKKTLTALLQEVRSRKADKVEQGNYVHHKVSNKKNGCHLDMNLANNTMRSAYYGMQSFGGLKTNY